MSKDKAIWRRYYIKNIIKYAKIKLGLSKFVNDQFTKKTMLSMETGTELIYDKLMSGEPFMLCRFGESEARAVADALGIKFGAKRKPDPKRLQTIYNNAGVFPYGAEMEMKFAEYMMKYIPEADIICAWNTFMQDYLIDNYAKKEAYIVPLKCAEPYYSKNPWSRALQGKKVLVIHPFAETIEKQYKKHKELFENKNILPDFELLTLKAVQTIAGQKDDRFNDWFDALDHMYNKAMELDFDVAVLGCGAYGFPLAARLKRAGKQALHMGGATQILFGIKGSRWDNHPFISKLYNEHWVRPSDVEKPDNVSTVEGGCYW